MKKGETSSGFKFEVNENVLDNMELVDALAEAQGENPAMISKVILLVLGKEQRGRLYEHLRNEDGVVPMTKASEELTEIFELMGQEGKN